jgi:ubiquinone/menaquinone biosynthesis C-methylase UbiE
VSWFSAVYERFAEWQDRRGLVEQRRRVGAAARGVVLDLGVGSGRNVPHYADVERVVGIDPDPALVRQALGRSAQHEVWAGFVEGSAERLPFADDVFDTVVVTLVLCTIPDPAVALEEAKRVLAPSGKLLFLEHERSPNRVIGVAQDAVEPLWRRVAGGCHPNRRTLETLESSGFDVTGLWRSKNGRGVMIQGTAVPRRTEGSRSR